jgi:hypothetical protein
MPMKTIIKIAIIATLWLTVINSGNLGVIDTDLRLQMAHAWWTGEEEVQISSDSKPRIQGDIRFGVIGVNGKRYIAYEQGQPLLMLPGDWIGTKLYQFLPIMDEDNWRQLTVSLLVFVPLNVAAVVACFWLLREFNFSEKVSGLATLTWLLGTSFLSYAQIHQQNNQQLLCIIIGYAASLAYIRSNNNRFAFFAGLALGASILIRITSIIHVVFTGIFFLVCVIYKYRNKFHVFSSFSWFVLGLIPFTFLGRFWDFLRYGSFFVSAKTVEKSQMTTDPMWKGLPDLPPNYPIINDVHTGIINVLFLPAKSLFIYDPFLLPCLILLAGLWGKISPYLKLYIITAIFNIFLHIIAYSRVIYWHGDNAWGARYHVTSIHLLLIPCLGLFIESMLSVKGWKKLIMQSIIAISVMVQIASVSLPMNLEILQRDHGMPGTKFDFRIGQRIINIACLANPNFSQRCIDNYPEKAVYLKPSHHWNFFPFNFLNESAQKPELMPVTYVLFMLWGLALIGAVFITWKFCFS